MIYYFTSLTLIRMANYFLNFTLVQTFPNNLVVFFFYPYIQFWIYFCCLSISYFNDYFRTTVTKVQVIMILLILVTM